MFTKCPKCKAILSFELPEDGDFSEDRKHRIKCPNCGATIGVTAPKIDRKPEAAYTYAPNDDATVYDLFSNEPEYDAAPVDEITKKKAKKHALGRNVTILTYSLVFIIFCALGYLVDNHTITAPVLNGLQNYNGIIYWQLFFSDFGALEAQFKGVPLMNLITILPMLLFAVAFVSAIVSIVNLIRGKYNRGYGVAAGVLIGLLATSILFTDAFYNSLQGIGISFEGTFNWAVASGYFFSIVGFVLGLTFFSTAIGFTAKIKGAEKWVPKRKKAAKAAN